MEMANLGAKLDQQGEQQVMYMPYMIRGLIYSNQKKNQKAMKEYEAAIDRYDRLRKVAAKNGMKVPADRNMANAYRNLFLAYSAEGVDMDKAMALMDSARSQFPPAEGEKNEWDILELQYYRDNPEVYEKGLKQFEKAIAKNPDDPDIKIRYAEMLGRRDTAKAIEVYEEVLADDPDNFMAAYNLGAFYNNLAKKYIDLEYAAEDEEKRKTYTEKKMEYLEKAYQAMKKAHNAKPDDKPTIQTLFQLAVALNKPEEEYKKYKRMLDN
jgi:tetratricopeptide (TPR) repeat protein